MKRRTDALLLAVVLLAFVALTLWLLRRTHVEQAETFPPLTTFSPKPSGALALFELLAELGREPRRFHETEYHYPPGACMVVLDPGGPATALGGLDPKAVRLWLERGGRLVLAAEAEFDDRGLAGAIFEELGAAGTEHAEITRASQLAVPAERVGDGKQGRLTPFSRFDARSGIFQLPADPPSLFENVGRIEHAEGSPVVVEAAMLLRSEVPLLWYRQVGDGELYWLTTPELASNAWIARADNHRLLLNLLDAATRGGRPLYFDEHLHGYLRAAPNVLALLFQSHGGHLLLGLCALTLLLFAGAAVRPARFAVEHVPERRAGTEMVLAQADLYERADARHVIADSQIDSLRRSYMERLHLALPPSEAQLLDWVEREWRGSAERQRVLAGYLRSKLLPRSGPALLDLARACDEAKSMLT